MFWLSRHAANPFVIIGLIAVGFAVFGRLGALLLPTLVLLVCVLGLLYWWQFSHRTALPNPVRQPFAPNLVLVIVILEHLADRYLKD